MTSFKEQVCDDIFAVFLNNEEFAEEMEINGERVRALWDDTMNPFALTGGKSTSPQGVGIIAESVILFVSEEDMDCPVPGEVLYVDGIGFTVNKSDPQMGVLRIEIERNTA